MKMEDTQLKDNQHDNNQPENNLSSISEQQDSTSNPENSPKKTIRRST